MILNCNADAFGVKVSWQTSHVLLARGVSLCGDSQSHFQLVHLQLALPPDDKTPDPRTASHADVSRCTSSIRVCLESWSSFKMPAEQHSETEHDGGMSGCMRKMVYH